MTVASGSNPQLQKAIQAMPVGAFIEDVTNVLTLKKYASTHAEHWLRMPMCVLSQVTIELLAGA